ncbi:MAG: hypothetical protein EHM43_07105 [Ignavibacteriae bacterium]|nr:MAG: hypothetical protein EHM43_07105 [Ignavibacteriota bacterium]
MFCTLFIHVPVLAVQMALSITDEVIVQERGRVVAPAPLRGIPAERAARLFPQSRIVPRRTDWERAAWDRIVEEVWMFTPYIVDQQVGRLICTPDSMPKLRRLVEQTKAHCGLASTPTLSALAAASAQPGGIMTVDADETARFLDAMPVHLLQQLPELGVDDDMVERLELFGLRTVGRLRMLTRHHLQLQFGDAGVAIHELLRTIGDARPLPLYQSLPSIIEAERFDDAVHEPSQLLAAFERCAERAIERLDGRRTQRLDVSLLDRADAPYLTRSRILKQALGVFRPLRAQIDSIVKTMAQRDRWSWGTQLRLASLSTPPPEQLSMFRPQATADDINTPLARRYPSAVKRIHVIDPNAYLPERFASMDSWLVVRGS